MGRSEKTEDDFLIAGAVDLTEIPMIDFAPFLAGGTEARRAVAKQIAEACSSIGFFYLKGHGVSEELQSAIFEQSAAFFGSPAAIRESVRATPDWFRGWVPAPKSEKLSRDTRLFEQYLFQLEWDTSYFAQTARAQDFALPNRWPDLPAFRTVVEAYLVQMHDLSLDLLRAFALGLDLPEHRFDESFRAPPSFLSLLYYPPLPAAIDGDVSNTVSHTDEGPITILAQGEVGGLEVRRRDGAWIQAPPVPGAFTINVGDMMMWWSNGDFLSNYHRVRNRSGGARFSIPFFCNPDCDVVVEPLPELVARTDHPRFPPVSVEHHLSNFYARQKARLDRGSGH